MAHVSYPVHIDIRDAVDYKEVMKQYKLGPNGGILTALNLFTTKFGQVLDLIDRRVEKQELDYILCDTPGQIEIFTWSASGQIILESLAASYPTTVVYVVDTPKTIHPTTFMSNMLYACSILYKTQLPMLLAFNKSDVTPCDFAKEWMTNFDAFQTALSQDSSYMTSLVQSMSLMLEEFYQHLRVVGCSAWTGENMPEFFRSVEEAVGEYQSIYLPQMTARIEKRLALEREENEQSLVDFVKDLALDENPENEVGEE